MEKKRKKLQTASKFVSLFILIGCSVAQIIYAMNPTTMTYQIGYGLIMLPVFILFIYQLFTSIKELNNLLEQEQVAYVDKCYLIGHLVLPSIVLFLIVTGILGWAIAFFLGGENGDATYVISVSGNIVLISSMQIILAIMLSIVISIARQSYHTQLQKEKERKYFAEVI